MRRNLQQAIARYIPPAGHILQEGKNVVVAFRAAEGNDKNCVVGGQGFSADRSEGGRSAAASVIVRVLPASLLPPENDPDGI